MHKTNENHLCCPTLQSIAHFDNQTLAFWGRTLNNVYSYLPQSQQHLLIDHPSPLKLKLIYFNFLRQCNIPIWPLGVLQSKFKASSNKRVFQWVSARGQAFPTMVPKAAYERPLTPSAPGSILTKGQRERMLSRRFSFYDVHFSEADVFAITLWFSDKFS